MRWLRGLATLWILLGSVPAVQGEVRLLEDLRYAEDDGERRLDLYLPDPAKGTAPLVVFVQSRLFDRADRTRDVRRSFARPLQRLGLAVAVVRHRLAPAHRHPAAAEDVATALAFLVRHADEYGYQREGIVLTGRSSGAHLVTLLVLDPQYLEPHGLAPDAVRAVVGWSGIYDLDPPKGRDGAEVIALYESAFGRASARRAASPRHLVRADAPLVLALVAQQDLPGARDDAIAFTDALREAGHPAAEAFIVPGRDHMTMIDLTAEDNAARNHFFALLGIDETYGGIEELFATRRFWRDPSFSTEAFWRDEARVTRHDSDDAFLETLNMPFATPGRPTVLRPETYRALDLLDYLKAHVPGGDGPADFLTVTNARGERVVWRRSELQAFRPQIVIGLDDQRELFEITTYYHTRRRYTWKQPEEERWAMARPLGAFVYFQEAAPPDVDPKLFGRFAITPDSFALSDSDPLAPLRDLPDAERALVTERFRCVSCHQLRGVGARAGHLRAHDGASVGGFALPLEEYPPEVWRRYCFEQIAVAEAVGANPVALGADARLLFELVERERRR